MRSDYRCYFCFARLFEELIEKASLSVEEKNRFAGELFGLFNTGENSFSVPHLSREVHLLFKKYSGNDDPYKLVKRQSMVKCDVIADILGVDKGQFVVARNIFENENCHSKRNKPILSFWLQEPTPFGLHDLELSVSTIQQLQKPFGVIVNNSGLGNRAVYQWLDENKIPLLLEVPFDKDIARIYSEGKILAKENPTYQKIFMDLLNKIVKTLWS